MLRAFSTAATGMAAQEMLVDVIANNLANINTAGFKKSQVNFQDLMYVKMQDPGEEIPSGLEAGSGVRVAATAKIFTQGTPENTDAPLDMAIQGDGFFKVTSPAGEVFYTRDGTFGQNMSGTLVTSSGYTLEPSITIPSNAKTISIAEDGTVTVGTDTGTSTVGQITLARFSNPRGLSSEGGNLFKETVASGSPTEGTPGTGGLGKLLQRFLERSNVQMVTELVNLIKAQRAYEINSRAIRAGDEMLRTTTRLIS